jgi:hypothetical protein
MGLTAANILAVITALPGLVKLMRELMQQLQEQMGPGTGKEKKQAVLDVVAGIVGDETVWDKVKGIFSWTIDCIAMFKIKEAK